MTHSDQKLYQQAWYLALFTIFYNLLEGVFSIHFGYQDETLSLAGFGIDSFIEVISGIGIAVMIVRIRKEPESSKSNFEKTALRITGISFYLLAVGLLVGVILNLVQHHHPETGFWGIMISLASILVMTWLYLTKRRIGKKLHSAPIIADGNCTKVCIYMSIVLLISSLIFQFTNFGFADSIGALGIIYFSVSEGKEALGKARGLDCCCEEHG